METRNAKLILNKAGGTAKGQALTVRATIPTKWARALNVTAEDRAVKMTFDGVKITIEKQ